MTPPYSLDAVHRDDALLDLLAGRGDLAGVEWVDGVDGVDGADDPALRLLAALAQDVDVDLPSGVDDLAVEALAAAFAFGASDGAAGAAGAAGPPRRRCGRCRAATVAGWLRCAGEARWSRGSPWCSPARGWPPRSPATRPAPSGCGPSPPSCPATTATTRSPRQRR